MLILISGISVLLIIFFILLLPKNSGLGSLGGQSDTKTSLPFTKSQKIYFILGMMFLITNYLYTY